MRKTKIIKAVIFDVDGVLLDTVPYHFRAWKKLFNEQGIAFSFTDYLQRVNGVPRLAGIANIMPEADRKTLTRLAEQKQSYFSQLLFKNPPKPLPGVTSLFKKLKKRKIKLVAASSSKNAPLLLDKAGLTPYLSAIISGHDFTKSKPDPELFLLASKRIGIKPCYCLVVEDALVGIQAGKDAKMGTIGLLTSGDLAIKDLADLTVKSLEDQRLIINFISKL